VPKPKILPKIKTYAGLRTLVRDGLQKSQTAIREIKVRTYWETGRLIAAHLKAKGGKAGYGHNIIHRLAQDLAINKTHLYHTLEFYKAFPIFPPVGKLGWTHYRTLLAVNNTKQRNQLAKRAEEEAWSVRALREAIAQEVKTGAKTKPAKKLIPRRGKPGVYSLTQWQGKPAYDLGFSVYKTVKTKSRKKSPKPSDLYTYKALVERVIDGDTLWAQIDLGFGLGVRQKLRFRGIDAPELPSKAGKLAKAFLEDILRDDKAIIVKTSKTDKYDRYLADIYQNTLYLNQLLLDENHAIRVFAR